jgi:two-component system, NarL family, response regulator NreC
MPSPVTIILADDHYLFRAGFKNLIATEEDVQLLSTATDGNSLLEQLSRHVADVVIMAIHLPGGLEACREIYKRYPHTGIIVLGPANNEREEAEMLLAGAGDIIYKTANMHQIVQCIKQLHYGDDKNDDAAATLPANDNKPVLNRNEIAVLQLLCMQMDSEEIGKQLYLSKHTIDHLRKTLLQKCGVKNTVGLVMYAVKNGIVKLEELNVKR